MRQYEKETTHGVADGRLLAYVAELELEVDRLRKQGQFVQHAAREAVRRVQALCDGAPPPSGDARTPVVEIGRAAEDLAAVLRDLQEVPGYHPARDQVAAIAVRPLVEQVFRSMALEFSK
jgi:hypothetical protein